MKKNNYNVKLNENTIKILDIIKKKENLSSIDEVINMAINNFIPFYEKKFKQELNDIRKKLIKERKSQNA